MKLPTSYSEAKRLGVPRYFTGAPCMHGHVAERTVKRRTCLECVRLRGIEADAAERERQRLANALCYATHREARNASNSKRIRAVRTGFTPELFAQRLEEQDRKCAICGSELQLDRTTHSDHCHVTLQCRGVLCRGCNCGLGCLKDSPELLRAAALYIEHWRTKETK